MSNSTRDDTFDCPRCGAPLEPKKGARMMTCKYCNNSVVIPEELRTPSRQPSARQAPLAAPASRGIGKGCARLSLVVALVGILAAAGFGIGGFFILKNMTKDIPGISSITSGFATKALTFGSQGIGQGMFSDARSVAVDGDGDILVGDYEDGRVQTFSPSGKYISTFSVGSGGVKALAIGPDSQVYVAHDNIVSIHDLTGREIGRVAGAEGTDALTFGSDGSMLVLTDVDTVKRFDAGGNLTLTIPNAFSSVIGGAESTQYVAADGLGNIYIIGDNACKVLKYSPTGQYLDQFGGKAESSGPAIPGTTFNPSGIAVDGYGRIFVSDWNTDVQVFNANGTPLQSVDALTLGFESLIYGMNIDNQGKIYLALGDRIMVLKIQAPSQ